MDRSLVPFLPEQTFIDQNRDQILSLFGHLANDFSDRIVRVNDQIFTAAEALAFDGNGELTSPAKQWIAQYTEGKQHGYDRPDDREQKIYLPVGEAKYMGLMALINCDNYNFVSGGLYEGDARDRTILVGGGFPHSNAGRLGSALKGDYTKLWEVAATALLTGQRRRWNDNPNEDTAETVFVNTAEATGLDPDNLRDRALLGLWQSQSKFAREQATLHEGEIWKQRYATEAEMGRLALEFAILRAGDNLFDWQNYPVIEHIDESAEDLVFGDYRVPARRISAWEYQTANGRPMFVVNGAAVARDRGGEPRPTSASVIDEAYQILQPHMQNNENIIAFGAPHIRAGYHIASRLLHLSEGKIAPLHLNIDKWERHEPPVTGIASIVGTDIVDKELRALVSGS